MKEISRGKEPYERITQWSLMRALTRDGLAFQNIQKVFDSKPAAWTDHIAMEYNPETQEYLLLKLKVDSSGFAYTAFFRTNESQWVEYERNPLFYDGDAMSLFWSPILRQYVCVSKSLQPHRKHIMDHGGATPSLRDDALRDRRVLMMRHSSDGRRWEPALSMTDVWNRNGRKSAVPAELMTLPDSEDPPDMEFYSGSAFWYHDRAFMMVLNYAASPMAINKHGPQLDNEWWFSYDGWRWNRPARGVNALDLFPQIPRLETHPMIFDGKILFIRGRHVMGLDEDRLSYVSARSHGEFSTRLFLMPESGLALNASVPGPERSFAGDQAYIMVSVLNQEGHVIPGYEAEKCIIRKNDSNRILMKWNENSSVKLAGQKIRLRFYLRSANIYAVTPAQPHNQ